MGIAWRLNCYRWLAEVSLQSQFLWSVMYPEGHIRHVGQYRLVVVQISCCRSPNPLCIVVFCWSSPWHLASLSASCNLLSHEKKDRLGLVIKNQIRIIFSLENLNLLKSEVHMEFFDPTWNCRLKWQWKQRLYST